MRLNLRFHLNLRRKMQLSYFSIMGIFVLIILGLVVGMNLIQNNAKNIYEDGLRPTSLLVSLEKLTQNTRVSMMQSVIEEDVSYAKSAEHNLQLIQDTIDQYAQFHMTDETLQAFQDFVKLWEIYAEQVKANIKLIQTGQYKEALEELRLSMTFFQRAVDQLDVLTEYNEAYAETLIVDSELNYRWLLILILAGCLIAVMFGLVISRLFGHYVLDHIFAVLNHLQEMAKGNLTMKDIPLKSKDELAQLVNGTNQLRQSLYRLVAKMAEAGEQLAASSEELSASSQESTRTVQQMAEMAHETAEGAEKQSASLQEVTAFLQQGATHIQQIDRSCQNMLQRSQQALEQTDAGTQMVHRATKEMNNISVTMNTAANSIASLRDKSTKIGEIILQITEIANQTNLLSLNASIEAARAGEHGQGFSVVANEIRKLAEQTRYSSEQTTAIIQEIQKEMQQVVQSNRQATEVVRTGGRTIEDLNTSFQGIRSAVQSVSEIIQEIVQSVRSLTAQSVDTIRNIQVVNQISGEMTANAQETSAASQEQLAAIEEIAASSETLSKLAEELHEMIEQFKIH